MSNQHRAYAILDGMEVEGYRIRVSHATANVVQGELVRQSRTPLPFTVEAQEHQIDVPAVQSDIRRDFAQYIRDEGLAPKAQGGGLILRY